MCEQNASYLAKHSELKSNNLNTICLKIIQKALKQLLQHVNFRKFSRGALPPNPLKVSSFSISFKLVLPKKIRWKKWGNYAPLFLKFLATPLPALVVGEQNLVIGFGPPHFRNASTIADQNTATLRSL